MKNLLSWILLAMSFSVSGTNYYVKNTGNDSNSGLSDSQAWATLTHPINNSFSGGDTIFFKAGGTFTFSESFTFQRSGALGNNIVITSYGVGDKPIIKGFGEWTEWLNQNSWTQYSSGVWRMSCAYAFHRLWINNVEKMECQTTALTVDQPWKITGGYLYIKSTLNPTLELSSISVSAPTGITSAISLTNISNVKINGIKTDGGINSMRLINCKNITIDNCEIGYRTSQFGIYISATVADSSSNIVITNNIFETGNSLKYLYYRGYHSTADAVWLGQGSVNCKIYNNYFNNWSHAATQLIQINTDYPFHGNEVYKNYITAPLVDYSRGFVAYFSINAYDNSIHDNIVTNTTIQNQIEGYGLKFYNNIIDNVSEPAYSEKYGEQNAISLEGTSTPSAYAEIYNNTLLNCDYTGIRILGGSIDKSHLNIHDNNILNNGNGTNYHYGYQMIIFSGSGVNNETYSNNHFSNGVTTNLVSYNGTGMTLSAFNLADTNGDVISGNDNIINYSIPVTTNYTATIQNLHFYYNYNQTTSKNITITSANQVDENGVKYPIGSVVSIDGLSSRILFTDPNPASNPFGWNKARILPNGKIPINSRNGYRVMVKE